MFPNMNNNNTIAYGPCGLQRPCPCDVTPIVCPTKTNCVARTFVYEQPYIVPTHTRIMNYYQPRPRYYPTFTTSEEDVCPGNNFQGQ